MPDRTLRLTDFPLSSIGFGRRVAVVGLGSAGCRIANQISKESKLLEHFVYVSCDEHDFANLKRGTKLRIDLDPKAPRSPYTVRGSSLSKLPEIRSHIGGSDLILLVAGLGGSVGTALAPVIAREARSCDANVVALLAMPYRFERPRLFYAGCALRLLKKNTLRILIVDNDSLLNNSMPLIDGYALANQKIALALNYLLPSNDSRVAFGSLNGSERMPCAVLSLNWNETRETQLPEQDSLSGSGEIQVQYKRRKEITKLLSVELKSSEKFDSYDPLDTVLKSRNNLEVGEEEIDSWVPLELPLEDIEKS